jgi:hypothetical protein
MLRAAPTGRSRDHRRRSTPPASISRAYQARHVRPACGSAVAQLRAVAQRRSLGAARGRAARRGLALREPARAARPGGGLRELARAARTDSDCAAGSDSARSPGRSLPRPPMAAGTARVDERGPRGARRRAACGAAVAQLSCGRAAPAAWRSARAGCATGPRAARAGQGCATGWGLREPGDPAQPRLASAAPGPGTRRAAGPVDAGPAAEEPDQPVRRTGRIRRPWAGRGGAAEPR